MTELSHLKSKAKASKKSFKKLYRLLEKKKTSEVDDMFGEAHEKVFSCTDCLACANCCRTTGPLFTKKDISRIAKYLGLTEADFITSYLRIDEDEDYVLKSTPCHFLDLETNLCSIYEVRPKACAEYPHTDMRNQKKLKNITLRNSEMCPAVYEILLEVQNKVK